MNCSIGWCNVWLFMVAGYGCIWITMLLVDRRRGRPIEDPALYEHVNRKTMMLLGQLPLVALLAISVFMPAGNGPLFWIGLVAEIAGIALNIAAMLSFANLQGGLNVSGIYRFSRNPMYVGGMLFVLGLNLLGWSCSILSGMFLLVSLLWAGVIHWTVLKEEEFLAHKYGGAFEELRKRVPRYIGIPVR
ncbi:MAG: isoprenylcysteine carboxylmethyltransferase family protein [Spirochaetes bacterium]|nr:isoprenylcysteine carboxylmethyltransferase family protein [Spirochaetota bacterium]